MSMIHFMSDPFPDNHNGFDYTPQSETDVHHEYEDEVKQKRNADAQNKMLGMFASIFK